MFLGLFVDYALAFALLWIGAGVGLCLLAVSRFWRGGKLRRRLGAAAFAAWTLLVLALLGETWFLLAYDATDSFGLTLANQRWIRRHVQRNSWGTRDREFPAEPPAGTRRIALLGDSFAFGHGVARPADRCGERLAALLNAAGRGRWEVVNLAEPGADTETALHSLRRLHERGLRFDEALLAYNLNDVERLHEDNARIVGSIIADRTPAWARALGCDHFLLPNFLLWRVRQLKRREVTDYFSWLKDSYAGPAWAGQRERFDALREWCAERRLPLRVAVFPFLHDLGEGYAFEGAHAALAAYFAERHVPACDLLPALRARRHEGLTVNRYDAHPNERCHELAAAEIFRSLFAEPPASR